jgi:hypothetical protein
MGLVQYRYWPGWLRMAQPGWLSPYWPDHLSLSRAGQYLSCTCTVHGLSPRIWALYSTGIGQDGSGGLLYTGLGRAGRAGPPEPGWPVPVLYLYCTWALTTYMGLVQYRYWPGWLRMAQPGWLSPYWPDHLSLSRAGQYLSCTCPVSSLCQWIWALYSTGIGQYGLYGLSQDGSNIALK